MRLLHAAVLATRSTPILSGAWRAAYAGASEMCASGLSGLPGVTAAVLHRGAARAPEPGVSDLDFVLLRAPLPPEDEAAWLAAFARRARRLKAAAPMLCDVWVSEPAELERYLRLGGLRAWEDRPGWRALRGTLPPPPAYAGDALKRRLDAWVWAFTAFMELSRRVLRPAPDLPVKREADCRKMHADAVRLSAFALSDGSGAPAPRSAAAGGEARALWLDAARALAEASLRLAADAAEGAGSAPPWPAPEDSGTAGAAEALRRRHRARALVLDAPYHTWAVLEDGAGPERLWEAARDLAGEPRLPGVPVVLTASAWALVLQSSYLGAPLGGVDGPAATQSPGLFSGWGPASVGDPRGGLARLAAERRRAAAAEAASWMALWWRGLWAAESVPNRFTLYHLHTRAAALARALDGLPVPSAWDELLEGPARRFAREEPAACVDGVPRAALDAAHPAVLARALAGLGARL